jgi:hypothetical protein
MADIPRPTKHSKVGSNLKAHKKLVAAAEDRIGDRLRPFRRTQKQYMKHRREILTRPLIRTAAELFRAHSDAYNIEFMKAKGNGRAIAAARRRVRRSIDRSLRQRIPDFDRFETLRRQYSRDYRRLVATQLGATHVAPLDFELGDVVLTSLDIQRFTPPYELFDVFAIDFNLTALIRRDDSFAEPRPGIVANDLEFRHNEDEANPLYNPTRSAQSWSSVGINYQAPKTGFLSGSAVIQNMFNKYVFSATDNFGLSHSYLDIVQNLFIIIFRAGEPTVYERTVYHNGLVAHGDDLSFTESPIENETPFTVKFNHRDALHKDESIQIMAGSRIYIQSDTDDMDSFAKVLAVWQVKKIAVRIHD